MPLDGGQHHGPGAFGEYIRILEHISTFCHDTFGIGLQQPAADQIVLAIHQSRFVAVQASPEAGKRNEVSNTAPLRSRLGLAYHYARISAICLHS